MSKILGNLYIFSKLTTTLVLFSLVVFMGYIFYKSYKSQNITKTDETFNQNIDLVFESIENNKQNLKLLKDKAQSTEIALNKLIKSIQIGNDGRFISTSTIPKVLSSDRTEFSLVDSGGAEKEISIRISTAEKRDVSETIKISMGHTPNTVKKGETITFSGNATPDKTLTMVTKTNNGDILNIETFSSGFDGKWTFDNLFHLNTN